MDDNILTYEKTDIVLVDGHIPLKAVKMEITYPDIEVVVATNGEKGGDSGHGGRTYFSILGKDSFDVASVNVLKDGQFRGVEMTIGGDCELNTLIQTFKYMARELEKLKEECKTE